MVTVESKQSKVVRLKSSSKIIMQIKLDQRLYLTQKECDTNIRLRQELKIVPKKTGTLRDRTSSRGSQKIFKTDCK